MSQVKLNQSHIIKLTSIGSMLVISFFLCQSMKKELNTFGGNMKSMHLMGCGIFEEHLSWPILQTSLRQIICFFLRAENVSVREVVTCSNLSLKNTTIDVPMSRLDRWPSWVLTGENRQSANKRLKKKRKPTRLNSTWALTRSSCEPCSAFAMCVFCVYVWCGWRSLGPNWVEEWIVLH